MVCAHSLLLPLPGDLCPGCQPHTQPSGPDLSSPRLPRGSAARAHAPHMVRCGPRHRQPWTTADCQRGTAAPSRQLPPTWPRAPQGHPAATPGPGDLPREPQSPRAGLGSRPLPGPSGGGVLAGTLTPLYMHTGELATNTFSHWDESPSLNRLALPAPPRSPRTS